MNLFYVVFILSLTSYSEQRSTPEDDHYVAGVVECQVHRDMAYNLNNYVRLISEAGTKKADIVVFPEMTLTVAHSVPVPIHGLLRRYPIPALQPSYYDQVLVTLSSAARQSQIYVVANVQEIMNCTIEAEGENCPHNIEYIFNTNVVFDRNGAVIDRYRKINLFGEYTRSPALSPDLGHFETDFGVRFGHFICFDLMFQVPAVQVVQKLNITDVVFSTMWFSEMPYLTAAQIQEAYTNSLNVNLLASGANNVKVGSAGSGIYSGKAGALVGVMPGKDTTRLLVEKVPKTPGQVNWPYSGPDMDPPTIEDDLLFMKDLSMKNEVNRVLVPGDQEFILSHNEVSCLFRVSIARTDAKNTPVYRAFVKDDVNIYVRRTLGIVSCAVIACQNENLDSCPYRNTSQPNAAIENLEIEMHTYKHRYNDTLECDNVVYFPSTLQKNKFPLSPINYTFVEKYENGDEKQYGGKERITMKLNSAQKNLVTFGIWGRIFDRDVDDSDPTTDDDKQKYAEIENVIYSEKKSDKEN